MAKLVGKLPAACCLKIFNSFVFTTKKQLALLQIACKKMLFMLAVHILFHLKLRRTALRQQLQTRHICRRSCRCCLLQAARFVTRQNAGSNIPFAFFKHRCAERFLRQRIFCGGEGKAQATEQSHYFTCFYKFFTHKRKIPQIFLRNFCYFTVIL